jgi:hypothetical protein
MNNKYIFFRQAIFNKNLKIFYNKHWLSLIKTYKQLIINNDINKLYNDSCKFDKSIITKIPQINYENKYFERKS